MDFLSSVSLAVLLLHHGSTHVHLRKRSPRLVRKGDSFSSLPVTMSADARTRPNKGALDQTERDRLLASPRRLTGTISRRDLDSGFIEPDVEGGAKIFFSSSDVRVQHGEAVLRVGAPVEYSLVNVEGKARAERVTSPGCNYLQLPPRLKGNITRVFDSKQYGFITPEDGGEDFFLPYSEVRMKDNGQVILSVGEPVEFSSRGNDDGKRQAQHVTGPGFKYLQSPVRLKGKVSNYFPGKFGYIRPAGGIEDGSADILFYSNEVRMQDSSDVVLNVGDLVEYSLVRSDKGKTTAKRVTSPGYAYVRSPPRLSGFITNFYDSKGYGFISPHDGSENLVFYETETSTLNLQPGKFVEYSLMVYDGKRVAKNVELLDAVPRHMGTITRFISGKGYGFVSDDDPHDSRDAFFPVSAISVLHCDDVTLSVGEPVEYYLNVDAKGRKRAYHLTSPGREYLELPPRLTGTVVTYQDGKLNTGYIRPADPGRKDIFFAPNGNDVTLKVGDLVDYSLIVGQGNRWATHVTRSHN